MYQEDQEEEDGADASLGGGSRRGSVGAAVDVLPWEDGLDSCPICGEDFDKYWDEDAEDGAGDWMLRGVIRLPAEAHAAWGGKVVMAAAWQSFVTSRQEKDDQPPSPTLMSPTSTPGGSMAKRCAICRTSPTCSSHLSRVCADLSRVGVAPRDTISPLGLDDTDGQGAAVAAHEIDKAAGVGAGGGATAVSEEQKEAAAAAATATAAIGSKIARPREEETPDDTDEGTAFVAVLWLFGGCVSLICARVLDAGAVEQVVAAPAAKKKKARRRY